MLPTASDRTRWLHCAADLAPTLQSRSASFGRAVRFVADPSAFQGWRVETAESVEKAFQRQLCEGDFLDFDFGSHAVGSLALKFECVTPGLDAPVCVRVLLGEMPIEIAAPRDPFHSNMLPRTWLQDETFHLDTLPYELVLPRRYAFRYIRLIIEGLSSRHRIRLTGISARLTAATFEETLPAPAGLTPLQLAIDTVAVRTLRHCLHTVFEDGPKRDRRLWLGDLRLQALVNTCTLRRFDLVKRCLLLFAGMSRPDGLIEACVFHQPTPAPSANLMADYSLLFVPTLYDYVCESGDLATAHDLWPIAIHQLDVITSAIGLDGRLPGGDPFGWIFIDWEPRLDKAGPFLGLALYCLNQGACMADLLSEAVAAERLRARHSALRDIALEQWRAPDGAFANPRNGQRSHALTAWMILGGVVTVEEAATQLQRVLRDPAAIPPAGPYLWHHVIHAAFLSGESSTGLRLIENYWGAMLAKGADTFWEVFDPADDFVSPYENAQLNSYCHAWSCTPSWFLRHPQFNQN